MSQEPLIPRVTDLLWPTLSAVLDLGGAGTNEEINERVLEREAFTEEQQAVLHGEGPRTEIEYRLAWARTYLKGMGTLADTSRGVWAATESGRTTEPEDMQALLRDYRTRLREQRQLRQRATQDIDAFEEEGGESPELSWKDQLIERLLEMPPDAFERLARRLLREAGFVSATVTGRSGDGGIDGIGVYRLSLVSFPVFFQCKRYRGSVRASAVRDFRGAMAGRGDKGLLITTGSYTSEAKNEATRDGAPPIDLIDGDRLSALLKEHGLGVKVTTRTIEDVEIESDFFTAI